MAKRITVFAVLVLGYVLTGMALNASQPERAPTSVATSASIAE